MFRKLCTTAAALTLFAIAAPVAGASAETTTTASGSPVLASPALVFIPPSVGSICAVIGPIIIGGNMVNPGLHVCTSGASLQPISWQPAS